MRMLAILGVFLFFGLSAAMAGLAPLGDPFLGHSWGQAFLESQTGAFDLVAIRMTSPEDYFESPTFANFTVSQNLGAEPWRLTYEVGGATPTMAVAQGAAQTSLALEVAFSGAVNNPLAFDFVAFGRDTLLESVEATWDGLAWQVRYGAWKPDRQEFGGPPVPAPGAVVLGALGLSVVGWLKRRL